MHHFSVPKQTLINRMYRCRCLIESQVNSAFSVAFACRGDHHKQMKQSQHSVTLCTWLQHSRTSPRCLQKKKLKAGSHSDAVLSLAWNPEYRNVVASGSADRTVKVWDIATQSCQATLQWHSDKVQAVCWNPSDAPVLLSGGFDKKACLVRNRPTPASNQASLGAFSNHSNTGVLYDGSTCPAGPSCPFP